MHPDDSVEKIFRLVPAQKSALKRLGIKSARDLLYHLPARYDEAGSESSIGKLTPGSSTTVFGTIEKLETRRSWKRKIPVGEARIRDASGVIKVMWFHQPYLAKKFTEGAFVKAVGQVGGSGSNLYLANPHVEIADPTDAGLFARAEAAGHSGALFAVYPETRGVTSLWFRHAIDRVMKSGTLEELDDPIPEDVRTRLHLPDLSSALPWIHTPEKRAHAEAARKRFAFEEIFAIQIARAQERAESDAHASYTIEDAAPLSDVFLDSVEFPPTNAQRRAIAEIAEDLKRGHPMARLLEGDVGSGKTLVAAAASYAVVNARPPERLSGTLQVAYMAPTEILAQQHFDSFIENFRHLPINLGLITGSGCKKFPSKSSPDKATDISRTQLLKWVESGEIAMVLGTHALIQKSVRFKHLALVIVDEQHRFGTRQRAALAQKSTGAQPLPHFLSMTATPIPRTLALTIYGDLDISLLDEMPAGRIQIETVLLKPSQRKEAYERIRTLVGQGRQAYVICPRINEPDPDKIGAIQARSAKAEAARLQKEVFPEFTVGLLHGAMKPSEKDDVMSRFAAGEIQILVATSVVEVGINVQNATSILIEGAERFGLAQLHQLRGRVLRSSHPPVCFLLSESTSEAAMKRLRSLEKSSDGFALAETDLLSRGAGDLYGRRQWGVSDLGMEALKNPRLIQAARQEALNVVAQDPTLGKHPALAKRLAQSANELHGE